MLSSFSFNFYIQHSKLENVCIFVVSNNKSFISQNVNVVGTLRRKFDFFSLSGFEIPSNFDYRTSKIKFCSVRALKCYLNEKNLIHGRVTATISTFGPQIFETYFDKYVLSWIIIFHGCFSYANFSLGKRPWKHNDKGILALN